MERKWILLWAVAVALLLLLIVISYGAFGALGNTFIATVAILAIIYSLVDFFWFQGIFLRIARKIGLKLKETKGGPDVHR